MSPKTYTPVLLVALAACEAIHDSARQSTAGSPASSRPNEDLFYSSQFGTDAFDPDLAECRGSTVSQMIQVLSEHSDSNQRWLAAYALGQCCAGYHFFGMRFIWPSREERRQMINAVSQGRTSPRVRFMVPMLADALGDESSEVRQIIAYSFVHIGPVAAPAVPQLRETLADDDPMVRLWAARALHGITLEASLSRTANVRGLENEDPEVRMMAAYNLQLMGVDGQAALENLRRVAESDPSEDVRGQARQAVVSLLH